MKGRRLWIILGVVLVVAAVAVVVVWQLSAQGQTGQQTALATGTVTTVTDVQSVESSGSVEAQQSVSLSWETTGTVGDVYVKVGDTVKEGEVLMAIDAATAPQSVIQAQADLITAKETLDNLLNPSQTDIANAQKAVADAEETLKDAKQDLTYVENPVGKALYDAIDDAKLALDTAQGNANLARVGTEASAVKTAEDDMNLAYTKLQRAQVAMDDCDDISCGERDRRENDLNNAQKEYQRAWDAYQTALLDYSLTTANQSDDVTTAQEDYDQAVANLNAAKLGPDALKLQTARAAVAVAEADLADKQETLDKLQNEPDQNDVISAQAAIMAAQAAIDSAYIKAPFDGVVLAVNYQKGDLASQSEVAVMLANRSQLHIEVSVDESDISQIANGNAATISFDALPDVTLDGLVTQIAGYGTESNGLIKYTVRVDTNEPDPRVLLGMTANVTIVTSQTAGALAVPIYAVQVDDVGEYVNRVGPNGTVERVAVVSGSVVDDDTVIVTGDLKAGDTVQVVGGADATTSGGGGFGAAFGGRP